MIKICKEPFVYELDDRWGQAIGVHDVMDIQGWVDEAFWRDIQEFEGYALSERGRAEQAAIRDYLQGQDAFDSPDRAAPYMAELLERVGCGRLIREFNMKVAPDGEDYVRSFTCFNVPEFREWTPEHDALVAKLREEAKALTSSR